MSGSRLQPSGLLLSFLRGLKTATVLELTPGDPESFLSPPRPPCSRRSLFSESAELAHPSYPTVPGGARQKSSPPLWWAGPNRPPWFPSDPPSPSQVPPTSVPAVSLMGAALQSDPT